MKRSIFESFGAPLVNEIEKKVSKEELPWRVKNVDRKIIDSSTWGIENSWDDFVYTNGAVFALGFSANYDYQELLDNLNDLNITIGGSWTPVGRFAGGPWGIFFGVDNIDDIETIYDMWDEWGSDEPSTDVVNFLNEKDAFVCISSDEIDLYMLTDGMAYEAIEEYLLNNNMSFDGLIDISLTKNTDEVVKKIPSEYLEVDLSGINSTIASLNNKISSINDDIDDVYDTLDGRYSTINSSIISINSSISSINSSITSLNSSIISLYSKPHFMVSCGDLGSHIFINEMYYADSTYKSNLEYGSGGLMPRWHFMSVGQNTVSINSNIFFWDTVRLKYQPTSITAKCLNYTIEGLYSNGLSYNNYGIAFTNGEKIDNQIIRYKVERMYSNLFSFLSQSYLYVKASILLSLAVKPTTLSYSSLGRVSSQYRIVAEADDNWTLIVSTENNIPLHICRGVSSISMGTSSLFSFFRTNSTTLSQYGFEYGGMTKAIQINKSPFGPFIRVPITDNYIYFYYNYPIIDTVPSETYNFGGRGEFVSLTDVPTLPNVIESDENKHGIDTTTITALQSRITTLEQLLSASAEGVTY